MSILGLHWIHKTRKRELTWVLFFSLYFHAYPYAIISIGIRKMYLYMHECIIKEKWCCFIRKPRPNFFLGGVPPSSKNWKNEKLPTMAGLQPWRTRNTLYLASNNTEKICEETIPVILTVEKLINFSNILFKLNMNTNGTIRTVYDLAAKSS